MDDVDYRLGAGDFCLIQPGERCRLEGLNATITPFAHFDVFFNPRRRDSFPTRPGQVDLTPFLDLLQPKLNDIAAIHIPTQFSPSEPVHFASMLKAMIHAWHDPSPLGQLESQKIGTQLVFSLLQDFSDWGPQIGRLASSLDWLESYLSLHLAEPLRIQDMARQGGFSPSRFAAMVRQAFGMPPHQFLTRMRVRHAWELLERAELTLDTIAQYCRFSDVQHFTKTFKQHTGVTPGAVRKDKAQLGHPDDRARHPEPSDRC